MIQITAVALSKIVTATLESGYYPNQVASKPMHPEDAMNQIISAVEVISAALASGQVTISDKE